MSPAVIAAAILGQCFNGQCYAPAPQAGFGYYPAPPIVWSGPAITPRSIVFDPNCAECRRAFPTLAPSRLAPAPTAAPAIAPTSIRTARIVSVSAPSSADESDRLARLEAKIERLETILARLSDRAGDAGTQVPPPPRD